MHTRKRPADGPPFHGEAQCTRCARRAYYSVGGSALCGHHADKTARVALPKNPARHDEESAHIRARSERYEEARARNAAQGRPGDVTCTKIAGIFGAPQHMDGYVTVLPNFRHGTRRDGSGLPRLSPKSLGPVPHGQPGHPVAASIENMHQFSKTWAFELDAQDRVTPEAWERRKAGYADPVPHRHKFDAAALKARGAAPTPAFALYVRPDGSEARLTYVESRYVYCHWMERLAQREPQWQQLCKMRADGYNINISGYDGFTSSDTPWAHYLDGSRPFGHEKVLEAMLTIADPRDYPWNRYRREHAELYDGWID